MGGWMMAWMDWWMMGWMAILRVSHRAVQPTGNRPPTQGLGARASRSWRPCLCFGFLHSSVRVVWVYLWRSVTPGRSDSTPHGVLRLQGQGERNIETGYKSMPKAKFHIWTVGSDLGLAEDGSACRWERHHVLLLLLRSRPCMGRYEEEVIIYWWYDASQATGGVEDGEKSALQSSIEAICRSNWQYINVIEI